MRIAIVHDDLVQWGGAERVLLAITEVFPEAPIYTSVVDFNNPAINKNFKSRTIKTSFMQKIYRRILYKAFLPLYPLAFEQFDFSDYDLVISQTTRFAKAVITKPGTIHIGYSHTPPRFLWNFSNKTEAGWQQPLLSYLRAFDQVSANRVDYWLAGSKNAQDRLKKIYQVDSEVLYPFVDDRFLAQPLQPAGDYYLAIARLNPYKKIDLVIKACQKLDRPLKVVGLGPELEKLKQLARPSTEILSGLSEEELMKLIAGCRGVIIAAEEDFGLVSLEAQALGRGVIAFAKGGSLETVIEGKTGVFFEKQTIDSLTEAIGQYEKLKIDPLECRRSSERFSKANFKRRLAVVMNKLGIVIPTALE